MNHRLALSSFARKAAFAFNQSRADGRRLQRERRRTKEARCLIGLWMGGSVTSPTEGRGTGTPFLPVALRSCLTYHSCAGASLRPGAGNPENGRQMLRVMSETGRAMGGKGGGGADHPSRGSNQIYVCLTKLIASLRSPPRSPRRARAEAGGGASHITGLRGAY